MKKYVVTLLLAGGLSFAGTVPTVQAANKTTYICVAVNADTVIVLSPLSKAEAQDFMETYEAQGYPVVTCVEN